MATINFSVPERVKKEFLRTFAQENRSAIIAELMQKAVEERRKLKRRADAIDAILRFRETAPRVSDAAISAARRAGRP